MVTTGSKEYDTSKKLAIQALKECRSWVLVTDMSSDGTDMKEFIVWDPYNARALVEHCVRTAADILDAEEALFDIDEALDDASNGQ